MADLKVRADTVDKHRSSTRLAGAYVKGIGPLERVAPDDVKEIQPGLTRPRPSLWCEVSRGMRQGLVSSPSYDVHAWGDVNIHPPSNPSLAPDAQWERMSDPS